MIAFPKRTASFLPPELRCPRIHVTPFRISRQLNWHPSYQLLRYLPWEDTLTSVISIHKATCPDCSSGAAGVFEMQALIKASIENKFYERQLHRNYGIQEYKIGITSESKNNKKQCSYKEHEKVYRWNNKCWIHNNLSIQKLRTNGLNLWQFCNWRKLPKYHENNLNYQWIKI